MARRPRLLVVDDKPNFLALFRRIAGDELDVLTANDVAEARALLGRQHVDVIVSDVKMPGASGLDLLADVKNRYPEIEVILMTAFGAVPDAVTAIKAGAFHYLTKPFDPDDALALIRRALAKRAVTADGAKGRVGESRLIASSPAMQAVVDIIGRSAPLETPVLITGESGTGKDLVAREIHARSTRHGGPYVAIKCDGLPEDLLEAELFGSVTGGFGADPLVRRGLFQEAAGGTLVLDEVAALPIPLQIQMLKVLEDRVARPVGGEREPIDVRIIATTTDDGESLVADGRLRAELFYRLNVVPLRLPPLRERPEDIAPLAQVFLEQLPSTRAGILRLSAEALAALEAFDWPGNVRQLQGTVERAAAVTPGEEILVDALPREMRQARTATASVDLATLPYREVLAQSRDRGSKEYFVALLKAVGGNVTQAAERAQIHRESLHRLLKRYGLRAEDFRPK